MCATGRTKTDYLQIDAIGKLKVTSLQIPLWFVDFLRPPPPSPSQVSLATHAFPPPLHTASFLPASLQRDGDTTSRGSFRGSCWSQGHKASRRRGGFSQSSEHQIYRERRPVDRNHQETLVFFCGGDNNSCRNNHERRDTEEMGRRRRGEKVKKWGGDEGKEERSEADEERGRKRKRVIQVGYLSEVRRPGGKVKERRCY